MFLQKLPELVQLALWFPRFIIMCFPTKAFMYPQDLSSSHLRLCNVQDRLPSTMWSFGVCKTEMPLGSPFPDNLCCNRIYIWNKCFRNPVPGSIHSLDLQSLILLGALRWDPSGHKYVHRLSWRILWCPGRCYGTILSHSRLHIGIGHSIDVMAYLVIWPIPGLWI